MMADLSCLIFKIYKLLHLIQDWTQNIL